MNTIIWQTEPIEYNEGVVQSYTLFMPIHFILISKYISIESEWNGRTLNSAYVNIILIIVLIDWYIIVMIVFVEIWNSDLVLIFDRARWAERFPDPSSASRVADPNFVFNYI